MKYQIYIYNIKRIFNWTKCKENVLTITVVRLISLVLRFVMMPTRNRYLLHGNQIVVIGVDQRILELGLDHLEAGRVVRMRDDLHCKRANVTEHGEENVGASGIVDSNSRHPQKLFVIARGNRRGNTLISFYRQILLTRGAILTSFFKTLSRRIPFE